MAKSKIKPAPKPKPPPKTKFKPSPAAAKPSGLKPQASPGYTPILLLTLLAITGGIALVVLELSGSYNCETTAKSNARKVSNIVVGSPQ